MHLTANEPGTYDGISASLSGGPTLVWLKLSPQETGAEFVWVAKAKRFSEHHE
ncbi:hypothetical protein KCP71_25310 [Salmonella enterica subsp. enterica]|nr:hypothetical protein KCP71_25310 [Salmonella enterica subsp. enterica]